MAGWIGRKVPGAHALRARQGSDELVLAQVTAADQDVAKALPGVLLNLQTMFDLMPTHQTVSQQNLAEWIDDVKRRAHDNPDIPRKPWEIRVTIARFFG